MTKARSLAFHGFLAITTLLAGCATPVPKSEITPKLYASIDNNVALAVIDARPYVLSGEKTPQYEGFIRGAFGIPTTVYRPNRPEGERFVDQFADMVRNGLTQEGVKAAVVPIPVGASVADALATLSKTDARRYVVIHVAECNWEFGAHFATSTWKYDFDIIVAGPEGFQTRNKRFTEVDTSKLPRPESYNIFDNYSLHYRRAIETIFNDPLVRGALQN
jgi:hypothetical protein